MERLLGRFAPQAYALLRIVSGLMFACHGAQKLLGMFGGMGGFHPPFLSQLWFAGVIELVGGLLIAVGFYASIAAFIASGEMAVAYFQQHAPKGFWPLQNQGELAVLYCFVFLYIAVRGNGTLSVGGGKRT
ncbi:MAG TPA: DoxX family protein [Vicinamibacterales bacterium]|jgi:putative oxidoreductase